MGDESCIEMGVESVHNITPASYLDRQYCLELVSVINSLFFLQNCQTSRDVISVSIYLQRLHFGIINPKCLIKISQSFQTYYVDQHEPAFNSSHGLIF